MTQALQRMKAWSYQGQQHAQFQCQSLLDVQRNSANKRMDNCPDNKCYV